MRLVISHLQWRRKSRKRILQDIESSDNQTLAMISYLSPLPMISEARGRDLEHRDQVPESMPVLKHGKDRATLSFCP